METKKQDQLERNKEIIRNIKLAFKNAGTEPTNKFTDRNLNQEKKKRDNFKY